MHEIPAMWGLRVVSFFLILTIGFTAPASSSEFRYQDLVALIQKEHLQSIDDLIGRLPLEMRANYTLMYNSLSLQEASYDYPRAILFGHDGKLTCAFNGSESERGYDDFECFQFDDQKRSFEFRQITFPSKKNGFSQPQFSQLNQTTDGKRHCTECHRADPRPNWEQYPNWPGAYGSDDDSMYASKAVDPNLAERAHYIQFLNTTRKEGRYASLSHEAGQQENPYHLGAILLEYINQPNLRFTQIVSRLVAKRDARILSTYPLAGQYAYVLDQACTEVLDSRALARLEKTMAPMPHDGYLSEEARMLKKQGLIAPLWNSLFRSYDPTCIQCDFEPTSDPLNQYDTHDGSDAGLDSLVSAELVRLWGESGKDPLAEKLVAPDLVTESEDYTTDPYSASYFQGLNALGRALQIQDFQEKSPFCEHLMAEFDRH